MLTRVEIERLAAGDPIDPSYCRAERRIAETAKREADWLENLTTVCGGCPATCGAAGGKCQGIEAREWLQGEEGGE